MTTCVLSACSRILLTFFTSTAAVARGAVLSHVDRDNHLVVSRAVRVTCGVVCAVPVKEDDEEHVSRKHQWERDPAGGCYVPNHFRVIYQKVGLFL